MKKTTIMLVTVLFMIIGYAAYNATVNIYGLGKISENISDFKVYLDNLKVNDKENTGINATKDEFTIDKINGNISIDIVNDSTEYDTESYLECASIVTPDKTEWIFDYTGAEQTFTAPVSGTYKLETWGAQGGNNGGKGAYASGTIELKSDDNLYIYVGGKGSKNDAGVAQEVPGGYNGGGLNHGQNCCSRVFGSGGGATDVRLKNGTWNDFDSLKSRIMVAAGGGGTFSDGTANSKGGAGGTLTGKSATGDYSDWCRGLGGTQILGGKIEESSGQYCAAGTNSTYTAPGLVTGGFGTGGSHGTAGNNSTGGGSGYYGGSSSGHIASAGGGSSFISGYTGCNAISESSTKNNIIHTGQSIHYSGYYFTDAVMKSGDETMPTHNGSSTMTGNSGNGYARIILNSSSSKEVSSTDPTIIEAQDRKTITLKNINTNNLTCKLKVNKLSRTEKAYTGPTEWTFDYTGAEQTFTASVSGTYKLETWGAQGGNTSGDYLGSNGSYTSGKINLIKNQQLYVFVGGTTSTIDGGYNGGGNTEEYANYGQGYGGGGATDIRLVSGEWNDFESLKSRIMVSAGGGGASYYNKDGHFYGISGAGGGLTGYDGGYKILVSPSSSSYWGSTNYKLSLYGKGASQTTGGSGGNSKADGSSYCTKSNEYASGRFGIGGSYNSCSFDTSSAGGGGGYYGGGSAARSSHGAGGGSSFISGHDGCNSIKEESTSSNILHTGESVHYSRYVFTDTIMIDGNGYKWTNEKQGYVGQVQPDEKISAGHSGNGYARITLIK